MEKWAWDELESQVEDHGCEVVQFYLDQENMQNGNSIELDVVDVKFEEGRICVMLS